MTFAMYTWPTIPAFLLICSLVLIFACFWTNLLPVVFVLNPSDYLATDPRLNKDNICAWSLVCIWFLIRAQQLLEPARKPCCETDFNVEPHNISIPGKTYICFMSLLFNQNENLQQYGCHFCFSDMGRLESSSMTCGWSRTLIIRSWCKICWWDLIKLWMLIKINLPYTISNFLKNLLLLTNSMWNWKSHTLEAANR